MRDPPGRCCDREPASAGAQNPRQRAWPPALRSHHRSCLPRATAARLGRAPGPGLCQAALLRPGPWLGTRQEGPGPGGRLPPAGVSWLTRLPQRMELPPPPAPADTVLQGNGQGSPRSWPPGAPRPGLPQTAGPDPAGPHQPAGLWLRWPGWPARTAGTLARRVHRLPTPSPRAPDPAAQCAVASPSLLPGDGVGGLLRKDFGVFRDSPRLSVSPTFPGSDGPPHASPGPSPPVLHLATFLPRRVLGWPGAPSHHPWRCHLTRWHFTEAHRPLP